MIAGRRSSVVLPSVIAGAGRQTPLDDLIKPELNSSACFTRVYDAAHLRAHPKQKTTAMTVWLKYEHGRRRAAVSRSA